ncbi:MAG: sulfonate transport system substrate-binding protein, partial [Psychroserpens sp.]
GNPVKIIQKYIESPLLWGIHVGAKSKYKHINDLENTKAAISRYGSGSHLMAYVHAQNNQWDTNTLEFEIVNNLDGAVTALTNGSADYFMWEHFTTKPLVDKGTFRRLGDCPTPWPCFVIAATENFIATQKGTLGHILEVINLYTEEFKNIPSIDRNLANSYEQKLGDIQQWLAITEWSQSQMDGKIMLGVQEQLMALGLINRQVPEEVLLHLEK